MSVHITGNSHVVCLRHAGDALAEVGAAAFPLGNGKFESERFSRVESGRVVLDPEQYRTNVERRTGAPTIGADAVWGFLQIGHGARVWRDATWLTHAPAAVAGADLQPVSAQVLTAIIERDQAGLRAFYEDLLACGVRFFAIAAPAPRRDHPALVTRGIRPEVVAEIDRAARRIWRSWLAERGVPLVEAYDASTDADGFLHAHLGATSTPGGEPDRSHANDEYGRLLLPGIAEAVRSLG